MGIGLVGGLFCTDQNVGQLAIGSGPGVNHFIGGHIGPQHLADGTQQVAAHNRVVLGQHLQGDVLVDDLRGQIAQAGQVVNVLGIHQHAARQGAGLGTGLLVHAVEQRLYLGAFGQHQTVKMGGQRFAPGFQQRHGGFDNGALAVGQHVKHLSMAGRTGGPPMGSGVDRYLASRSHTLCQAYRPHISSTYREPCLFDAHQLQSV